MFYDVKIEGEFLTLFVFNKGKDSWQVQFDRQFLDDLRTVKELQLYVENIVILTVLANPGKRIQIDSNGIIFVADKLS